MVSQTLLWLTLFSAVVATAVAAPPEKKCTEPDNLCKEASECCAGCCKNNKCVLTTDCATAAANDPCYLHACPSGKVCYLAKVECLQSPCTPIPACKVDDSDYD